MSGAWKAIDIELNIDVEGQDGSAWMMMAVVAEHEIPG